MQFSRKSFSNLQALATGDYAGAMSELQEGEEIRGAGMKSCNTSIESDMASKAQRLIFVSNQLPLTARREADGSWAFDWDEDALVAQAKTGLPDDMDAVYVGCLPVEIEPELQDDVSQQLLTTFACCPVFLGEDLKRDYYNRFCKQQAWPLLHYLVPLDPRSSARFDPALWSAYVRANMAFANKLVEVLGSLEDDYVWIHDYHLLVLPSLLRKRFHRIKCGIFLHSPFPSSEIFRTFPRREEVTRAMLNADIIGFHTYDYARHFLSYCSRMLGLDHRPNRGAIVVEYYGRDVCVKIMPTGVAPERIRAALAWPDALWRRGELAAQHAGRTVLLGIDDMDVFKGIELKLEAFEQVLETYPDWRGRLQLIQVTAPPRSASPSLDDLHAYCVALVARINAAHGSPGYEPVVWVERAVPLYERVALLALADVVVLTATRDGMNLLPYEYVVAREAAGVAAREAAGGPAGEERTTSMLVVSEFVGCSPSLSGAIRCNPWSVEAVRDAIYAAVRLPAAERAQRHEKHWKYVSSHTVQFWARSFVADFQRFTANHGTLQCFDLGFALNTYRMVALTSQFRRLSPEAVLKAYARCGRRIFLLDYDGTLMPAGSVSAAPSRAVLDCLRTLSEDPANTVYVVSGRARGELAAWFDGLPRLGVAAEHGFYWRPHAASEWCTQDPEARFDWKDLVLPILQNYVEYTDGSYIEAKESALVWHYADADPDLGGLQAKELLDHLEGVLSNEPIEVVPGQAIVEVKPQGVSKGRIVERILAADVKGGHACDFVLCVGDDRSDEDMFAAMESVQFSPHMPAEVFACTVGQKPSRAPFYVNDPADVLATLSKLAEMSEDPESVAAAAAPHFRVAFG